MKAFPSISMAEAEKMGSANSIGILVDFFLLVQKLSFYWKSNFSGHQ